ncbi:MAG: hypothetical protein Q8M15_03305 [Bacteroidota bacterium]|nr:hypothetical protein [Bacteroidota bacterium]
MLIQLLSPSISYALSGGPSQPEFQSFEPIGTSEMVNLPSGDFTYNIPLLDVSGYPINIAYHSGITADMEATVVGLGWNINPGVINRNVRALPDDFNGAKDAVEKQFNMKPNVTAGSGAALSLELFGLDSKKLGLGLNLNLGVFFNSYWGMGCEFGLSPSLSAGDKNGGKLTASMGLNTNSQSGANFSPNLSYSKTVDNSRANAISLGCGIGLQVNSRDGLKALSISATATKSLDRSFKKNENIAGTSQSTSASFSYSTPIYVPEVNMDMMNKSFSLRFSPVGGEIFGLDASVAFSGYVSSQKLLSGTKSNSAYGMLYAHNAWANSAENSLTDFAREKDGAFADHTVSLPILNPGNDIYSVSGQGIGGSYQLKRSDVGVFYDAKESSNSFGGDLGLELGTGNAVHVGVDIKMNSSNSTSSKWTDGNDLLSAMDFRATHPDAKGLYEPAYFKAAGEVAAESDLTLYKKMGYDQAVRPDLTAPNSISFKVKTREKLAYHNNTYTSPNNLTNNELTRDKRDRRQQTISYLTAKEAQLLNVNPIYNYTLNSFINPTKLQINRVSSPVDPIRKAHHISEIITHRSDGLRYVYGIPAYNIKQRDVTFNVSTRTKVCSNGKVKYSPSISNPDNSVYNQMGKDNFFNAVETKPYAHSYLLTAILSQDYQDLTGNGISEDDLGSYTVFNYSRIHADYQWRVPIDKDQANYSEGLLSDPDDDKGSYIYGKKEIWVLHSVESKTMVAEFLYDNINRGDGFGVLDENGGINTNNRSVILKTITLYARNDRKANQANAMPVKTVHFDYDYSLCPGTENSNAPGKGKLTLTKLYFTYGYSQKAGLSAYRFAYKNADKPYGMKSYDRWGNYKRATSTYCTVPTGPLTNTEYPYSEQNESIANDDAGTWCLDSINLPSGGIIKINYQAKHYAYVQDRNAMQMMKIAGIGSYGNKLLYNGPTTHYEKVYFDVIPGTTPSQLKRDYLRDITVNKSHIYLKCFVKMNSNNKWEYLPVYAQITGYGVDPVGSASRGWVSLKLVPKKDDGAPFINPISKMAFQFIRQNMPEVAFGQSNVTVDDIMADPLIALQPIAGAFKQLGQLFIGFNTAMLDRSYGQEIELGRSFIRLYDPRGKKLGGGSMVSRIEIKDNWDAMTGGSAQSSSYGQEYDYTTSEQQSDGSMRTISSGVASYEPVIGGDENPFRKVVEPATEERKWAIDNIHYTEEPFGECFMPAPDIAFSKITIRNMQYANVTRTATGHTEQCYYTAKDFPTKLERTDLQRLPRRINPIFSLLKVKMKEHMNAAQGFSVITNNMHGQLRSKKVFDENGTYISGIINHFKTDSKGQLENAVDFIYPDGKVEPGLLGVDFQMAGDARQSINKSIAGGVSFNLETFVVGIIPLIVPVPWPDLTMNESRFRSMTLTKIINKIGILEKVEAFDLGSTIMSENMAYDAETGECLLTKTGNEFNDPVYNLKLPAHWAYEGMQNAYKNIGFTTTIQYASGVWQLNAFETNVLMPGDELSFIDNSTTVKVWVLAVNRVANTITLIDRCGSLVTSSTTTTIKVIRSGRRNMPAKEIGTITSLKNPISGNPKKLELNCPSGVLNSKAVEFSDAWQTYCTKDTSCAGNKTINPYVHNLRGVWRNLKSWSYLSNRKNTASVTPFYTDIRKDGVYTSFTSFWHGQTMSTAAVPYPYKPVLKNMNMWTWTTEITKFDPNGIELENRDRLGRFSSEIIGYHHLMVTGVASNSRYKQIAFDGFEDYAIPDIQRHFGDQSLWSSGKISNAAYHTGKYSLRLNALQTIVLPYALNDSCPLTPMDSSTFNSAVLNIVPVNKIENCDCIKSFAPSPGKYVVTAWVKEGTGLGMINYTAPKLNIEIFNYISSFATTFSFSPTGDIIDGWQRISGEFNILPNDVSVTIKLINGGSLSTYFDDIRILPFNGSMKNYVYDDISLKLMAELDDNGYATFYEYNAEGQLIRIKKETERGIMTIKESRSAQPKQN